MPMTSTTRGNAPNLLLTLIVLSVSVISCAFIKGAFNKQSDKVNKFNYEIPYGYKSAEGDPESASRARFTILVPATGQIMMGSVDSTPIDLQTLGKQVDAFFSNPANDDRAVYLAASRDVDVEFINNIVKELRKHDIHWVRLLTSNADRHQDRYGNESGYQKEMGDIPAPHMVFEVRLRPLENKDVDQDELEDNDQGVVRKRLRIDSTPRPNPLTLVANYCIGGSQVCLNNEKYEDVGDLTKKLSEIFRLREENGVFREGSNEIEKTVFLKLGKSERKYYGFLIDLVDAAKSAGASPIILADEDNLSTIGSGTNEDPPPPKPVRTIPKVISGGVLNGKAANLPKPEYPPAARAVRASGTVTVQVLVDVDGKVITASAVGGHPLLQSAAVTAARAARFAPTLLSGQPVKVSGVIVYNFVPDSQ